MDLPSKILASLFAPLMFAGLRELVSFDLNVFELGGVTSEFVL